MVQCSFEVLNFETQPKNEKMRLDTDEQNFCYSLHFAWIDKNE